MQDTIHYHDKGVAMLFGFNNARSVTRMKRVETARGAYDPPQLVANLAEFIKAYDPTIVVHFTVPP